MEIGRKFNELNFDEYIFYIDNHKKYSDFNTLGLYRSLLENDNLSLEEKLAVRARAHAEFQKTFDFLQLKDPRTFVDVTNLGLDLTFADERQQWHEVKKNQQKILKDKKIGHRNFGTYSLHDCGYDDCIYNGLMVRQGSVIAESGIHFQGDKNKNVQKVRSDKRKADRKKRKWDVED